MRVGVLKCVNSLKPACVAVLKYKLFVIEALRLSLLKRFHEKPFYTNFYGKLEFNVYVIDRNVYSRV